jgi:hypothetical protein
MRRLILFSFLLSTCGCAAVFRDSKVRVHVDSEPHEAEIRYEDQPVGKTPGDVEVERGSSTSLKVSKPGYTDSIGTVNKHLNAGWAVADVATCVIPVALCIPLLIDAISGAWMDVDNMYRVRLEPGGSSIPPPSDGTIIVPPPAQDAGVEPGTIQL